MISFSGKIVKFDQFIEINYSRGSRERILLKRKNVKLNNNIHKNLQEIGQV